MHGILSLSQKCLLLPVFDPYTYIRWIVAPIPCDCRHWGSDKCYLKFVLRGLILCMEEILHHLRSLKLHKEWDKPPINWFRISSIHRTVSLPLPDYKKIRKQVVSGIGWLLDDGRWSGADAKKKEMFVKSGIQWTTCWSHRTVGYQYSL